MFQWKSIKSAPKNGAEILVFDGDEMFIAHFNHKHQTWVWSLQVEFDPATCEPTHWLALPDFPVAEKEKCTGL